MFYQIFFTPQLKRCTIITNKHGYTSCRTKEIRKYQESLKTPYNNSLVSSLPSKMKILLILAKIS